MIIIRNNFIPFKGFSAMNILGVLFVRSKAKINETTIRHEAIHTRQQYEIMVASAILFLWVVNTYSWLCYLLIIFAMPMALYVLAWLVALVLPPYNSAYKDIPFEREAYANQHYPNYLDSRPWFAWVRYVRKS
jgi:hypothetical protein